MPVARLSCFVVMTVTPVAKWAIASRNVASSTAISAPRPRTPARARRRRGPTTNHTPSTGSVTDVAQAVRRRRVERDRVARADLVRVEADRHLERPSQHEPVLAARVTDEAVALARRAAGS
jgi:hypothetical protein